MGFRNLKFGQKLLILVGLIMLVFFLANLLSIVYTSKKGFEKVSQRELDNITESVFQAVNAYYLVNQKMVGNNAEIAATMLAPVIIDSVLQVRYQYTDSSNGRIKTCKLPSIKVKPSGAMPKEISAFIDSLNTLLDCYVAFFQFFDDGLILVASDNIEGMSVVLDPNSSFFKTINNRESFNGILRIGKKWYQVSANPVIDGNRLVGAVLCGLTGAGYDALYDLINSFKPGQTYFPFIMNSEGDIIIHPYITENVNVIDITDLNHKAFMRQICSKVIERSSYSGNIDYLWKNEVNGQREVRSINYKYLPQLDWIIAIATVKQTMFEPVAHQIFIGVLISVGLFLIMIVLLYLLSKRISGSFKALLLAVKDYSGKNFSVKLPVNSTDEIGELSKAFNDLSAELYNFYNAMEVKVQERTTELYLKNEELQKQKQKVQERSDEIQSINEELQILYDALKDSEEKYRNLVESLKNEYIFYSQLSDGSYKYISPSIESVLGYTVEEAMKGLDLIMTGHPMNKHALQQTRKAFLGQQQPSFNVEIFDKKGEIRIFEVHEFPVSKKGVVISVEAIAKDITGYVHNQNILKKEKEFAELILKVVPSAVLTVDKNRSITTWNKKAEEITGYTAEEVLGKPCQDFVSGLSAFNFGLSPETNTNQDTVNKKETIITTKNGNKRTVIKNIDYLTDYNGVIVGGIESFEDITDRKTAEENLQKTNELLKKQKLDLETAITKLKNTQLQLVHAEKMAALGQLISGIAHEINTPLGAISASSSNLTDSLKVAVNQLPALIRALARDGIFLFISLLKSVEWDLPELNSRERRLLKKGLIKELDNNNIANADLIAEQIIYMKAYKSLDKILPLLKQPNSLQIVEYARTIVSLQKNTRNVALAVSKASKVVFALKKFIHRDMVQEITDTNLNESIETVLTLYQNQIKHGIEVIREYADLPLVPCIADEISQVWSNLIHNAIQAMNYKGKLKILTYIQEGYVVVSISDTGEGIPPEILNRIFEPFFTTKAQGEGTGLGLDIVKKIVDKHNGRILVNSKINIGTTFEILIPLNQNSY